MRGQHCADVADRVNDRIGKPLMPKMLAHKIDNPPPISLATFFVDRLVTHNRELVYARRHKNQHGIAFARFVNTEPMKFLLRRDKWIDAEFAALNINADLTGSF